MADKAIAIDAMSGDFGPRVIIPATIKFIQQHADVNVYLVGQHDILSQYSLDSYPQITVVHTPDIIAMDEKPAMALRNKKDSSLLRCVSLVEQGMAAAAISAGNTGALMAISKHQLKMIPGVSRPALCGALPSLTSHSYLLDMGANVDCSASDLLSFAKMAQVLVTAVEGRENPSVALLNIGEEGGKGNHQVKEVAELLKADGSINYTGFIEADKMYQGVADIILCDGFIGNIALKASEGVASYILEKIKNELKSDPITKALSYLALPEFLRIKSKIDPRRFNGACLLGINGIVVKSHGHADEEAFGHALEHAFGMLSNNLVEKLHQQF
jgi:glycerol-3-phosphate acyltransferase PlsX